MRRRNIPIILIFSLLLSCVNHKNDLFKKGQRPILYFVTDPRTFTTEELLNHIEQAIKGGVDVVQLRDKKASDADFLRTAKALMKITMRYKVPLIINDRVHLANQLAAAGIHVGQSDLHQSKEYRMGMKDSQIMGFSIVKEQQMKNIPSGVDYLGVGPVFATKTKSDADPCMGLGGLRRIRNKTDLPIIAIGGIRENNITAVIDSGADGVAVIGALMDAKNPEEQARRLKSILMKAYAKSKQAKL